MKTTAVFCFIVLLGLAVAKQRGPCGCKLIFEFCANDYHTYHSICEYKCKHHSTAFQDWFILYLGPCVDSETSQEIDDSHRPPVHDKHNVQWIPSSKSEAASLSHCAVVAGYDEGSPLWVIRAHSNGDLLPGKYNAKLRSAYVPWQLYEYDVVNFEVCCARPDSIRWVPCSNGAVPAKAVVGGKTNYSEALYVGRVKFGDSFVPGKVHPSHKTLYVSSEGKELHYTSYEVLCTI